MKIGGNAEREREEKKRERERVDHVMFNVCKRIFSYNPISKFSALLTVKYKIQT